MERRGFLAALASLVTLPAAALREPRLLDIGPGTLAVLHERESVIPARAWAEMIERDSLRLAA